MLFALSGIDASGWGYTAKAVRTGPVAEVLGIPRGPGSEFSAETMRTPHKWHG